ncbi:unnamed protein product [Didymodactylos carnosus]|uniref:Uncharacterized protein n=1 Tax=Didymodactylos carnosus TaxID=1234261 RepID=A0A814TTD2_9BILA|nr:unnamed protein product [Didymodactylos carnosus]CAF1165682.1 unnamed protein product [Didymodactylos carnosus]CAF3724093.1 unnamed protein product [Didymodactylos carnosus]CAF3929343.1 unnamed protein product [Didymodactylos carnosus]
MEKLPNEILLCLFENYTRAYDLFDCYCNLNTRINDLIKHARLQIDLSISSTSIHEINLLISTISHSPEQLHSLQLSDRYFYSQTTIFFKAIDLENCLNIRTLILLKPKLTSLLDKILLKLENLPHLETFSIDISNRYNAFPFIQTLFNIVLNKLFLKKCRLIFGHLSSSILFTNYRCQTLEYLSISLYSLYDLTQLVYQIPNIKYLDVKLTVVETAGILWNNNDSSLSSFAGTIPNLTSFKLFMICVPFNEVERLLINHQNLKRLSFTSYVCMNNECMSGNKWHEIVSTLPKLQSFQLDIQREKADLDYVRTVQLPSFSTNFWIDRNVYVSYYYIRVSEVVCFHTLPYFNKKLHLSLNDFDFGSTMQSAKPIETYESVNHLQLTAIPHPNAHRLILPDSFPAYVYKNLNSVTFCLQAQITCTQPLLDYIKNVFDSSRSSITCVALCQKYHGYLIDPNWLITILNCGTHINTLRMQFFELNTIINQLSHNNDLRLKLNKMIRHLNLNATYLPTNSICLEQFCSIFSNLRSLVNIRVRTIADCLVILQTVITEMTQLKHFKIQLDSESVTFDHLDPEPEIKTFTQIDIKETLEKTLQDTNRQFSAIFTANFLYINLCMIH